MGHLFQVEWLVETSQWVFIWFIMEKEIGKGNGKGFGKVRGIIGISFMKITEISRKGRWKVIGFMWGGKWRKIMENEENRGHIDEKGFWGSMGKLLSVHLWLAFYSLSHTLGRLEYSWRMLGGVWHTWDLEQEGKGRAQKHKRTLVSTTTIGFSCRYWVACMNSFLVLECIAYACGFLVVICHGNGGFLRLIVVLPSLSIY